MNTRAKGFIPDPTGHRWTRFKAHAAAKKIADMPGSASVAGLCARAIASTMRALEIMRER